MTIHCDDIKRELLELGWTPERHQHAVAIAAHLHDCRECRQAQADYQAIQTVLVPSETATPPHGWSGYEERLQRAALAPRRAKRHWGWSIAAALLISALALNAALLLRSRARPAPAPAAAPFANGNAEFPSDMTDSAVAKVYSTVSAAFEGRTHWVMLSDESSEVGLADQPAANPKDLLILRLVVTHGGKAVSQVHLAIVPGATARVTVPSHTGEQLEYVIATDAQDPHRVALWMALEGGIEKESGLGSMATSLSIPYGQSARTGQIMTRDGTFDLSMSLQRQDAAQAGAGA